MRRIDPHQLLLNWEASGREAQAPSRAQQASPSVGALVEEPPKPSSKRPRRRRAEIVARMPVPRPLPGSVEAGHFGHDDEGKVIRPQTDEIRAITEVLADRLLELLDALPEVKQPGARQGMLDQFTQAIQMYALEFGERPARQLEAFVRRQASLEEDQRTGREGWQR